MKNFDSRTYSINDFLEWYDKSQLELSPKFQRRSVWTDNARSYLMDTIVRGKPIAKIFIRQKINIQTRQSIREVVDGQQRLRTIISFVNDGFKISKRHHTLYGGLYFSQLDQVDDEIQAAILNYEISTDLLVNMPDAEILDVFSRLNSYSVTLNDQERINANHFSPFKTTADSIAHSKNDFWLNNKILNSKQVLRMGDVTMTADLLIAMLEGIQTKKKIKSFYAKFEKEGEFEYDTEELVDKFQDVINKIELLFPEGLKNTNFKRSQVFYTLFTSIAHCLYGIPNLDAPRPVIDNTTKFKLMTALSNIDRIFETDDSKLLSDQENCFLTDSRRATTDTVVRERRTKFLLTLMNK